MQTRPAQSPERPGDGLTLSCVAAVVVSAVLTTAVIAIPYWSADYASVRDDGIFGSFRWVALALFLGTFLAGTLSDAALWLVAVAMVVCTPVAVIGRVVIDTSADPTSHSLWPLEVVLSCAMAAPAVGLGIAVAWAVRVLSAPRS